MASDQPAAWTVIQQVETTDLAPSGVYVSGVRVTFRTLSGVTGSVFVPTGDYTLDRVKAAIGERAAVLESVSGLTG